MSFAIITISGNITRDAEVVNFKNGNTGVKFGIAVNDSKDHVSFYDVLFSEKASVDFLIGKGKKGSAITIVGDVVINAVDGKNFINVYGRTVVELFSRRDGTDTDAPAAPAPAPLPAPVGRATTTRPVPPPPPVVDTIDVDFPF